MADRVRRAPTRLALTHNALAVEIGRNKRLAGTLGGRLMTMSMFVSFLGVLLVTLVVFLGIWAIGRITLGR